MKFKNKYRSESHRRPGWDYSSNAMYFLTLVTQHRICNLGQIVNEKNPVMQLSDYGKIVDNEWRKSFEIRNELIMDEYIIMPNHIHAIVIIENNDIIVESYGRTIQQLKPFYRLPKSISSFIAGYKSAVNTKIDDYIDENKLNISKYNRKNHFFQNNYYDHIIRNEKSYKTISEYIRNNQTKWMEDRLHNK